MAVVQDICGRLALKIQAGLFIYFPRTGDDVMPKINKTAAVRPQEDVRIQEFLDMIAPSVIKFNTDHFICGNTYRCVWALREYHNSLI